MSEKDRLTRELSKVKEETDDLKVHTIQNAALHVSVFACLSYIHYCI